MLHRTVVLNRCASRPYIGSGGGVVDVNDVANEEKCHMRRRACLPPNSMHIPLSMSQAATRATGLSPEHQRRRRRRARRAYT